MSPRVWKLGFASVGAMAALLSGCQSKVEVEAPKAVASSNVEALTPEVVPSTTIPAQSVPKEIPAGFSVAFEKAAILDEIPEDQQPPVDRTISGKSTAVIRASVEKVWSAIPLVDASGKAIEYRVIVTTSRGEFEIQLDSKMAPNHVRNLIALANVGYYDGLRFDRTVHQESELDGKKVALDLLRVGCPQGTGDAGTGHLGYFLKPEIFEGAKHATGTVGFWRETNPDTACCQIYITLGDAPSLDGEFTIVGKVTRGLDLLQAVAKDPVKDSVNYPDRERPVRPVSIEKVRVLPELPSPRS
jgi:cyclophilin family peptidyl-prolyl cis-trans isomerase